MKKSLRFLALCYSLCFAMCLTLDAHAYIDPATTTYVFQAIAGVLIACGATVLVYWRKIQFWFKAKKAERIRAQRDKQSGRKD